MLRYLIFSEGVTKHVMSRVLFTYEKMIPTVRLLQEKYCGYSEFSCKFLQILQVDQSVINAHDVFVFIRPSDPLTLEIAKKAKKAGAFTVFYTDDDLLALPKTHSLSDDRKKRIVRIANQCEMVLAANPYICRKYAELVPSHRYALTVTSVEYLDKKAIEQKLSSEAEKPIKIVYAAGKGHESLFFDYIEPVLKELDRIYAAGISLDFVGVAPSFDLESFRMGIHYVPSMPLTEYRRFMSAAQYDIGLAPLEESVFSRAKHYNKYIEYTAAGIVGVYSNVEPYTNAVVDGYNGVLPNNNHDDWKKALIRLIDNDNLRRELLKNASEHIETHYTVNAFLNKLKEDAPEFFEYDSQRYPSKKLFMSKVRYKAFRIYDLFLLSSFYLKKGGLNALLRKLKSYNGRNVS